MNFDFLNCIQILVIRNRLVVSKGEGVGEEKREKSKAKVLSVFLIPKIIKNILSTKVSYSY